MDKRVYGVVMICPAICIYLCLYSLFFLLCFKCPDILINISTSSFTKVLYYSVEGRKKKLYFLSLQITDRNLAIELSCLLFSTLIALLTVTSVAFFTFLLVEMSYECTEGFECFKSLSLDYNPVNCEVAISEDVSVTCYRFTFNPFLAIGLGYGVLKVGVAAIYFWSVIILWIYRRFPKAKCICNGLLSIAVLLFIGIIVLLVLNEYYPVISPVDSMKLGVTIMLVISLFIILVGRCPWSRLAQLESPVEDFSNDASSSGSRSGKYFYLFITMSTLTQIEADFLCLIILVFLRISNFLCSNIQCYCVLLASQWSS